MTKKESTTNASYLLGWYQNLALACGLEALLLVLLLFVILACFCRRSSKRQPTSRHGKSIVVSNKYAILVTMIPISGECGTVTLFQARTFRYVAHNQQHEQQKPDKQSSS
jgi:heme/copper-type cytochrome/quinol oxidase subunit 2